MADLCVGTGFDAHAFEPGVPLVIGGMTFRGDRGLAGHSDGDVVTHALIDAILGAAALGDIGTLFPSDDPTLLGVSSLKLLREAYAHVQRSGWRLVNADVVLIGNEPKIAPSASPVVARDSPRRPSRCSSAPLLDRYAAMNDHRERKSMCAGPAAGSRTGRRGKT